MNRVLIICLGNICRSPMGQGALEARMRCEGMPHECVVDSAGVSGWHEGSPPDPQAIACAQRHGVDIAHQRARRVVAADFERFDWLLCADRQNLDALVQCAPAGLAHKAALWLAWAGGDPPYDIPDPYRGSDQLFDAVWQRIDRAAQGTVRRLLT